MSYHNTIRCENTVVTVDRALVKGNNNVVIGNDNTIKGNGCKIYGDRNSVNGHHHRVFGVYNSIKGNNNIIQWDAQRSIYGHGNWVLREYLQNVAWNPRRYEYECWPDSRKARK